MLGKLWQWLKARWACNRGYCPACYRKFLGQPDLYNYKDCGVCEGRSDGLVIWSRWRNRKSEPPVKVLHKCLTEGATKIRFTAKEAILEKE